jgi:hypothetical protein
MEEGGLVGRDALARRRSEVRQKFGLTTDQHQQIIDHQGGRCAICRDRLPDPTRAPVDHHHDTGVVRGVLCSSCNTGLGLFRDRATFLRDAIEYLRSPPARQLGIHARRGSRTS